jgi:hypothetical protein
VFTEPSHSNGREQKKMVSLLLRHVYRWLVNKAYALKKEQSILAETVTTLGETLNEEILQK